MKVLIIDKIHESLFELLTQIGLLYDYQPLIKREHILELIPDYEGLVVRSKTLIDADFLKHAPKLKFIARAGAGLDLIDVEAANQRNIKIFSANEGNKDAVAEQVVGMLLGLMANINKANHEVKTGIWNREANRGYELMGKTVGLLGYGFNGKATAKRLSGFDCKVLAYDKYLSDYGDSFATEASLEQIFEEADILSLHIPLTEETSQSINNNFFAKFIKPLYFINASRGEIVNLEAIVNGLKSGKIRGAGLDVLENENISQLSENQQKTFDYLKNSESVILTPHIAGWTFESYVKINEALVKQLKQAFGL